MNTERKYEPIKENRGWYFVEYNPPHSQEKFSRVNLVVMEKLITHDVVDAMERECNYWLKRFPVPILVSAFDNKGDLYDLSEIKSHNHLIGFFDENRKIELHWSPIKYDEIPNIALDQKYVDDLYSNLKYKTYDQIHKDHLKKQKSIKTGRRVFFIWLVISILIGVVIAFLDYFNTFVSLIALLYSLFKAIQKLLEITGKWPKSKKTKEKEKEEELKNHYYYHCQMNPEGFNRLKLENFEKIARNNIKKEAESIKAEDERKYNQNL